MSGNFLLDTNAASAYLAQDATLLAIIEAADEIFVPAVVLGELFYGVEKSGRVEANRRNAALYHTTIPGLQPSPCSTV